MNENDTRKVKPYDVKAEVLRDDGNIVWVKIPGGIDETPVQKTNNANVGDTVMVRIANGKAWIAGNNTSPATDDTQANAATQLAVGAGNLAEVAAKAASDAQESASIAYSYADQAKTSADQADENAKSASKSATSALYGLSTVQDVVGTLNWVEDNISKYIWAGESKFNSDATYYITNTLPSEPLSEVSLDIINETSYTTKYTEGHVGYYEKTTPIDSLDDILYEVVNDSDFPISVVSPVAYAWYKKENDKYIFLEETEGSESHDIYAHTTHYRIEHKHNGERIPISWSNYYEYVIPTFTKVENPVETDLNTYYTADLKTAMADYIKSHLALTDDGLYVMMDGSGWKYKVTNEGAYILDPGNIPKAIYKTDVQLGNDLDPHRMILSALALSFFFNQKLVGRFGYDEMFESYGLYAENVLIKGAGNALRLDNAVNGTYQGQYILETRANGHISLKPGLRRTEED